MKSLILFIPILLTFLFCNAQDPGKIDTNIKNLKAGVENLFSYQPPKNLVVPDKIEALILYQDGSTVNNKFIPITKISGRYQFSFKAPDSTAVLIIAIVDARINLASYNALLITEKKIVDNNNEAGFIIYLHNNVGKRFPNENIELANLLSNYAPRRLKIRKPSNASLIGLYEQVYALHPELKNANGFVDYLSILYREKGDSIRPLMLDYIGQMLNTPNESRWQNALNIYRLLKMTDEQKALKTNMVVTFPNGELAKQMFWNDFYVSYSKAGDSEQSILANMNDYIKRFNDSSSDVKDQFFGKIASFYSSKKDWASFIKYQQLINNKGVVAYTYNKIAWELSGGRLDNDGMGLDTARLFSKNAINIITNIKSQKRADQNGELQGAFNKYLNTYALILYKLHYYDSAFYYQDIVYRQPNASDTAGIERYAVYAEKVKGITYAKQIIEKNISLGKNSPILLEHLRAIYKQLGLSQDAVNTLQMKSDLANKQKARKVITAKLGAIKAKNFVLKNLLGQQVSLSSFANKVVVLDFWAIWCGPCRASFPAMQDAVNKYKGDSEVVFLFIDVWENKSPDKMQEAATKFMDVNKYKFNVLLDINDEVVNAYKIGGIPTKIVINKKGNIVFMSDEMDNISQTIDAAKN